MAALTEIPECFRREAALIDGPAPLAPSDRQAVLLGDPDDVIQDWLPPGLPELAQREQGRWRDMWRQVRDEAALTAAVGSSGWVAIGDAVTAAAAGTAKTVLNVIAAANRRVKATEVGIGFIGASGTAKPVLVELCTSTQAGAGSGSSAVTIATTDPGDASTVQATAAKGYTSEPTVLTAIRRWRVHPQAGAVVQFPLGREPSTDIAKGICLRVTFESGETTTNIDCYLEFEE